MVSKRIETDVLFKRKCTKTWFSDIGDKLYWQVRDLSLQIAMLVHQVIIRSVKWQDKPEYQSGKTLSLANSASDCLTSGIRRLSHKCLHAGGDCIHADPVDARKGHSFLNLFKLNTLNIWN